MKYNTIIPFNMTARYLTWEPKFDPINRVTFRTFPGPYEEIKCNVTVTQIGAIVLYAPKMLQSFGIVYDLTDASGTIIMDEFWHTVQKVAPIMDASGSVSSYRHTLAGLVPEVIHRPIQAVPQYPDLDQVRDLAESPY